MKTPDIIHDDKQESPKDATLQCGQKIRLRYAGLERTGVIKNIYSQGKVVEYLINFDETTWAWINKSAVQVLEIYP